jgi:hypothetical protein
MTDFSNHSIFEYILAGLYIGMASVFFIVAVHALFMNETFDALENAGMGLMFLGGTTNPKGYIKDLIMFPFYRMNSSLGDTHITVLAGILGSCLWAAGFLGNWLQS